MEHSKHFPKYHEVICHFANVQRSWSQVRIVFEVSRESFVYNGLMGRDNIEARFKIFTVIFVSWWSYIKCMSNIFIDHLLCWFLTSYTTDSLMFQESKELHSQCSDLIFWNSLASLNTILLPEVVRLHSAKVFKYLEFDTSPSTQLLNLILLTYFFLSTFSCNQLQKYWHY